ncbi:hypothetical protein [Moheibacter sp.]|uniref:hypothetical protein n=1 Tax=Moheibacter sp. TaxID=1965316 RepID=UPI003C727D87
MKYFVLTFLLFIFFNCTSSKQTKPIEPNPLYFSENNTSGLVVGTLTFVHERARFGNYSIQVVNKNENEYIAKQNSTTVNIIPDLLWKPKHRGELDNGQTYLIVFKRMKGSYEINHIDVSGQGISTTFSSVFSGFSIPFNVEEGKITYIGNLIIDEFSDNSTYGIIHRNNFDRDIEEFQKIYPNVKFSAEKVIRDTIRIKD